MESQNWFDIISKFSPATLIGGIGGYFIHLLQTGRRRRRMRLNLYREISINNQYTAVWIGNYISTLKGMEPEGGQPFTEKLDLSFNVRSEERRVGKECRSRWS